MLQGRVLQLLKSATDPQHRAIERRLDLPRRLHDSSGYVALLGRLYGFYAPTEVRLNAVLANDSIGLEFATRQKTNWLCKDLRALGHDPRAFPLCPQTPVTVSIGQALGCLYVLEGATLGGQMVRRMVGERLGLSVGHGCAFFAAYGDRVGEMWNAFRAVVVTYAATPTIETEVVTAARETFAALDRWLAGEVSP